MVFATSVVRADANAEGKAIRAVMEAQTKAWNAGDIDGFMQGYQDSQETIFIGKKLRRGYSEVHNHYKTSYASKSQMGTLDFSDINVRLLSETSAVVTGRFRLTFPETGAAPQSGIFSLVWVKTGGAWKIVLDHTSAD